MKTKIADHTQTATHQQSPEKPCFHKQGGEEASPDFTAGGAMRVAVPQAPVFHKSPGIQTKLLIGQPGDKYEQEADLMAENVVQKLATPGPPPAEREGTPVIQPKCAECVAEEKKQENELTLEEPTLQRKSIFESNEEVPAVQNKCAECEQEEKTPGVQTQADASVPVTSLEQQIGSTKNGGNLLSDDTRNDMEGAFGADFSSVRVHTDDVAVQMNQKLGAQAFTHGSDIYFSAGKYDTGSGKGKELLAHELTHVVQQGGDTIRKKPLDLSPIPKGVIQRSLLDDVVGTIGDVGSAISSGAEAVWEGASDLGHRAVEGVAGVWEGTRSTVGGIVSGARDLAIDAAQSISGIWDRIVNGVRSVINNMVEFVRNSINTIVNYVQNLIARVTNYIQSLVNQITQFISETIDALLSGLMDLVNRICNSICDGLLPLLTLAGALYNGGKSAYDWASNWLSSGYSAVRGWFSGAAGYIGSLYNSAVQRASSLINTVWNWVQTNIPFAGQVGSMAGDLVGRVNNWVGEQVNRQVNNISSIYTGLRDRIAEQASSSFTALYNPVKEFFRTRFPSLFDKISRVKRLIQDLMRVDWTAPFDTAGMEGDWGRLFLVWLCEQSPSDLGAWTTQGDEPTVTIIPGSGYTTDLQNRPHHQAVRQAFMQTYPDLSALWPGKVFNHPFSFTGEGTATGGYNVVEWFLGSYNTRLTVLGVDQNARTVSVKAEVTNQSHWEAATRVPAVGQNAGLPRSLIPDMARADCGPGGDFRQRFIWNELILYPGARTMAPGEVAAVLPIENIAARHMIYEFAAHRIAYLPGHGNLTKKDKNTLMTAGYGMEPDEVIWLRGTLGFQVTYIKSTDPNQNDLIAIRGTNPGVTIEDLMTVYSDLDPRAVGMHQYLANRRHFASMMEYTSGRVDVTGHSLGGAMAQHVGSDPDFAPRVANVITFQSPGINRAQVESFNAIPESMRPNVIHHIVTGDVVDRAGEANLPGAVYEHNLGNELNVLELIRDISGYAENIKQHLDRVTELDITPVNFTEFEGLQNEIHAFVNYLSETARVVNESHGTFVFAADNYEQIRSDHHLNAYGPGRGRTSTVTAHETYPHPEERNTAESVRRAVGPVLSGIFERYFWIADRYEAVRSSASTTRREIERIWLSIRE